MKKLILSFIVLFSASIMISQNTDAYMEVERAALKTEKKAFVADAMDLTDAESGPFWALYNEYNDKQYVVNTKVYENLKDYAEHYETITDEKALELWGNHMKYMNELAKLRNTYFKKFQKILPGKKVARYFQIEYKVWVLISAQLAVEIPLVGDE